MLAFLFIISLMLFVLSLDIWPVAFRGTKGLPRTVGGPAADSREIGGRAASPRRFSQKPYGPFRYCRATGIPVAFRRKRNRIG